MQMLLVAVLATAALAAGLVATAEAAERRVKANANAQKRDCTPINGRYGYYGNPWCDTGSYRLEDRDFRARQLKLRNANVRAGE